MKALLDGDIYAYRSASSAENDDVGIAIWRMEEMIDNTLAETNAGEFSIFLSGEKNFRYDIYPEYKANRPKERPRHLRALKDYLIEKYQAQVSDGCEADDLLGIAQCSSEEETVICSLDKDLRMIPGNHYSFEISGVSSKGERWVRPADFSYVDPNQALRNFYYQVLVGDAADNVKGAKGIGPVKANKILDAAMEHFAEAQGEQALEAYLFDAVQDYFSTEEELLMTGQVLWIFRKPNDVWQFPTA